MGFGEAFAEPNCQRFEHVLILGKALGLGALFLALGSLARIVSSMVDFDQKIGI